LLKHCAKDGEFHAVPATAPRTKKLNLSEVVSLSPKVTSLASHKSETQCWLKSPSTYLASCHGLINRPKKKKKDADKKSKGGREKGREKKKKSLKKVEEFHPQTFCPDAGPPDVARK
jgi:hypothetical protein